MLFFHFSLPKTSSGHQSRPSKWRCTAAPLRQSSNLLEASEKMRSNLVRSLFSSPFGPFLMHCHPFPTPFGPLPTDFQAARPPPRPSTSPRSGAAVRPPRSSASRSRIEAHLDAYARARRRLALSGRNTPRRGPRQLAFRRSRSLLFRRHRRKC